MTDWPTLRWCFITNTLGVGVTGTGMAFSQPGSVLIKGLTQTAAGTLTLYDHTNRPQNRLGQLTPGVGVPDYLPAPTALVKVERGVYVSYSMGTGTLGVGIGWRG